MSQALIPSTWEAAAGRSEFKASHGESSRTAKATPDYIENP